MVGKPRDGGTVAGDDASFIGPLPPDPKTGRPRSHVTGRSRMRDELTGKEYVNSWDIEDRGEELRTQVGGNTGTDRFRVSSSDPEVIKHFREVQRQAARAAYYKERVVEATPIPKPAGRKLKARAASKKTCPECGGTGRVWFGEFEDSCSRCEGAGQI